ncbi:hypothetical protein QA601_10540 [Chitinispirillales bacterium ANBcel5]|uniref:hypothetical protein n=1 Tax=Cellulosispirillum alkaliphilum TaxID=3039283 RepID=UPI002A4F8BB4|nr:hypothetical protein [Chitinispirillales bacterium ANBcel5]
MKTTSSIIALLTLLFCTIVNPVQAYHSLSSIERVHHRTPLPSTKFRTDPAGFYFRIVGPHRLRTNFDIHFNNRYKDPIYEFTPDLYDFTVRYRNLNSIDKNEYFDRLKVQQHLFELRHLLTLYVQEARSSEHQHRSELQMLLTATDNLIRVSRIPRRVNTFRHQSVYYRHGLVHRLGEFEFEYSNSKISEINGRAIKYGSNNRIIQIGDVEVKRDFNTIDKIGDLTIDRYHSDYFLYSLDMIHWEDYIERQKIVPDLAEIAFILSTYLREKEKATGEFPAEILELYTSIVDCLIISQEIEQIRQVEDLRVDYTFGKVTQIGDKRFEYSFSRLVKAGDTEIHYKGDNVSRIGDLDIEWRFDDLIRIGDVRVDN